MADEPSLNFKFSLDLSDFDKAPKVIDDALQHIANQAEAQGKNADMAMAKWVQDMIKERESRVAELTKQIEDATRAYAETFANFQNGNATYEDWEKSYEALNKLKDELSQTKDELNLLNEKESEVAGNASFLTQLKMKAQGFDLYGKAMSMLPAPIANVIKSTKLLDGALKGLLANPIVLAIAGIITAIKALSGYADMMANKFETWTIIFGTITEAVRKFKEVITAIITLDWKDFVYNLTTMFDGGAREIQKRNELLAQSERQVENEKLRAEIQVLNKRASNRKRSFDERIKAQKEANAKELKILENGLKDQEQAMRDFYIDNNLYHPEWNPKGLKTSEEEIDTAQRSQLNKLNADRMRLQAQIVAQQGINEENLHKLSQQRSDEWSKEVDRQLQQIEKDIETYRKKRDYQRQVRESLENEKRRLQALARSNEYSAMENIINDMADGIEKSSRQAELKMKQSLDQLNDAIYAEAQQLYNNEKNAFERNPANEGKLFKTFILGEYETQARSNIDAKGKEKTINDNYQRSLQKSYDAQIKQFQTYADKRTEIERQASEQRLAFEKKGMRNSEQAQLAELDRIKKLFAVDLEEWQNGSFVQTALDNISTLSKESLAMLEKEIDKFELDEAMKGIISDETVEQFNELREKIEEARIPYQSLGDAMQQVRNAQEALNKAREKGDPLEVAEAEAKLVKAMDVAKDKYDDTMSAIQRCADAVAQLGEKVGGVVGGIMQLLPNVVGIVSGVGDAMKAVTAKTVASLKAIETASIILEIISLVVQLGEAIAQMFESRKEEQRQVEEHQKKMVDAYASITKAVYAYKQAMIDAKHEQDELWAGTTIDKMQKAIEKSAEAQKALEEMQSVAWEQRTLQGVRADSNLYSQLTQAGLNAKNLSTKRGYLAGDFTGSYYQMLETGFNDMTKRGELLMNVLSAKGMTQIFNEFGEFNLRAYKALKEEATEAWEGLAEVDRKQLDAIAEVAEQYEEYIKDLSEAMADWYSPLLDNMTDAWMNWLDTGEDVMDTFKDYSKDTFREIVKDQLKQNVFKDVFKPYIDQLSKDTTAYLNDGVMEEGFADKLAEDTKKMMGDFESKSDKFKSLLEAYDKALEGIGIDINDAQNGRNAEARGIARASQESVDENNARLAMMQQHTYTINANVAQLVSYSASALEHLSAIHSNTNRLERIEGLLSDINTYGVRTR